MKHSLIYGMLPLLLIGCCEDRQVVNPGARIPIILCAAGTIPCAKIDERPSVRGMCHYDLYGASTIYLEGPWNRQAGYALHEYTHALEHALDYAGDHRGAQIVRHAFLGLSAGGFQLGHMDLMEELK